MNLQEMLDFLNFVCNKEQTGLTFTPEQYNTELKVYNLRKFKKSYGLPEEYDFTGPFNREVYERSQLVSDRMRRFKVVMGDHNSLPLTINSYGVATIPSNYFHVSSIRFDKNLNASCATSVEGWTNVEVLTDDQWADRIRHSITGPSLDSPFCMFQSGEIWFRPKDLNWVQFTYLRLPNTPVYAYTIGSNDEIIYDATSSTQLEWDYLDRIDIALMMLADIGINLKEENVTQYSALVKQQEDAGQ